MDIVAWRVKGGEFFWDADNLLHWSTRAFSDFLKGFPLGFDLTAVSLVRRAFAGSFREGISGLRPSVLTTVSLISYQTRSKSSEVTSGWNSFWVFLNTRQSPRRQSSGNSPSYRKAGCSSSSTSVIDEHGQQLVRVGCCSCLSRRPWFQLLWSFPLLLMLEA